MIELFVQTAKELKRTFGLSLFGFDVILPVPSASFSPLSEERREITGLQDPFIEEDQAAVSLPFQKEEEVDVEMLEIHRAQALSLSQKKEKEQRQLMVIDVNYFPSYKEVKDFPSRLKKYLRTKAFQSSSSSPSSWSSSLDLR